MAELVVMAGAVGALTTEEEYGPRPVDGPPLFLRRTVGVGGDDVDAGDDVGPVVLLGIDHDHPGGVAHQRRGPGHMGEAHIPLDEDIQPPRTGRVGHGGDRTIGTRGWPPYVNPATEIAWRRAWYGG